MDDLYWNQGKNALPENHGRFMTFVDKLPNVRREEVRQLLDGPLGEQFFLAPASSRKEFHYAFPCGLLAHTLNVIDYADSIAKAVDYTDRDKVLFAAMFHDIGKAGTVGKPYYKECSNQYRRERGEYFEVDQSDWMPTSEKGLFVLQQHGIVLDHDEYMAIRLNDGAGPAENKPYAFRTPTLALLIHQADTWAMMREKEELLP